MNQEEIVEQLMNDIKQRFSVVHFSQYLGCQLLTDKHDLIQQLEDSPFKHYLQLQNNLGSDTYDIDELIDVYFPEPTPVSVAFYLNMRYLTQSLTKMDEIQNKKVALAVISKTTSSTPEELCSRYIASLSLNEYQQFDLVVEIQKEMLAYLSSSQVQTRLLLDTGLFAFPVDLVKLILAKNYIRNMQPSLAIPLMTDIKGLEMQLADLLQQQNSKDEAQKLVQYQIEQMFDHVEDEDISERINKDFVFKQDFVKTNFQAFNFKCDIEAQIKQSITDKKQLNDLSLKITILGELQNNPHLFALAISLNMRNPRAFRDLGCYFITEFKQTSEDSKQLVINASYLLMCAYKLEPSERTCRENLCSILILTKSQLHLCRQIYVDLVTEFGDHKEYYHNIGLIDYANKNYKSAIDYYIRAVKLNYAFDVTLVYQILQLLVDLKEKENYFKTDQVIFVLDKQLETFYLHNQNNKWKSKDEQITYLMNFLWHVNQYIEKLFNWIIDQTRNQPQAYENAKRIFKKWLQFVADHCATVAGDEVLGTYLEIHKRFV
ncbi:Conserved_hypothetical protein [Hexamita inflata]|uniref:Uncharacterized protein n=1 Tax=Hexamita inflata TaxID=28002 RepID=A0ABP1HX24_9EUKA